jgi:uncharacterized protein YcbX
VKGLLGEALDEVHVDERGVVGDRSWAVVGADGKLGSGKTTRRFRRMPRLFTMASRTVEDDVFVRVGDWEGSVHDPETARRVSDVVGEPVTLERESTVRHHDEGGLHLVTTATLRQLDDVDARRLRPNIVLEVDGAQQVEDSWTGRELRLGDVIVKVTAPMPRCVMVTLPQSDLAFEPSLLSTIEERFGGHVGVVAEVVRLGVLRARC